MEDQEIIKLYFDRNEKAIEETDKKYGDYCFVVANNILNDKEDSKECLNDTYLATWNAIPPQRPYILKAFLAKIVRNISLNKWRNGNASKRGGDNVTLSFDEIDECVASNKSIKEDIDNRYLAECINIFLGKLKDSERDVFVCRYFYFDSIEDISKRFGYGNSKVKMMLKRTRDKLKEELEKEGIVI